MNLADNLTDGLSDAAGLFFGEFGVKRCQRRASIKVSTMRVSSGGMVTFGGD